MTKKRRFHSLTLQPSRGPVIATLSADVGSEGEFRLPRRDSVRTAGSEGRGIRDRRGPGPSHAPSRLEAQLPCPPPGDPIPPLPGFDHCYLRTPDARPFDLLGIPQPGGTGTDIDYKLPSVPIVVIAGPPVPPADDSGDGKNDDVQTCQTVMDYVRIKFPLSGAAYMFIWLEGGNVWFCFEPLGGAVPGLGVNESGSLGDKTWVEVTRAGMKPQTFEVLYEDTAGQYTSDSNCLISSSSQKLDCVPRTFSNPLAVPVGQLGFVPFDLKINGLALSLSDSLEYYVYPSKPGAPMLVPKKLIKGKATRSVGAEFYTVPGGAEGTVGSYVEVPAVNVVITVFIDVANRVGCLA